MKVHVSFYKNLVFFFCFCCCCFCSLLPLRFKLLCCPSEWVSVTIESEHCRFRSDVSRSLKLSRWPSFLQFFTEMLLSYIFGPSVVKYDIVSNNRRRMLHTVIDLDCLFFSVCCSDFLLSFWTYSAKSTLILAKIFSTHLFLNSPTKSCNPIRAMTTRKKRNKTKTSLSSFRERSNVLTIARRPETSNKSFIYHPLPLILSF